MDGTSSHVIAGETMQNGRESPSSDHRNNVGADKEDEDDDEKKKKKIEEDEDDEKTEEEYYYEEEEQVNVEGKVKVEEEVKVEEKETKTNTEKIITSERVFSLPNPYYQGPDKSRRGKLKSSAKFNQSSSLFSSSSFAASTPVKGKGSTGKKTRGVGDLDPPFNCKFGTREKGRKFCSSVKPVNHIKSPFGPGSSTDGVKTETMRNPFARRRARSAPPDELTLMFVRVMEGLPPFEEEQLVQSKDEPIYDIDIESSKELSLVPNDAAPDDIILQEFNEKDFYNYLSDLPDEPSDEETEIESNPCDLK